jgi:hypothetical protein
MIPCKKMIFQTESGYACYDLYLIWQSTRECPESFKLEQTPYGKGYRPKEKSKTGNSTWTKSFGSMAKAEEFANEWIKAWCAEHNW